VAAGKLPERIAFDKRVTTDDGYGGTIGDFAEQFIIAADYKYLIGGEAVLSSRLTGTQPVVIRVRETTQTSEIKTDWRARDMRSGVTYNITSVMPAPNVKKQRLYLDVLAVAGGAA
jgi:head-tail adaptor